MGLRVSWGEVNLYATLKDIVSASTSNGFAGSCSPAVACQGEDRIVAQTPSKQPKRPLFIILHTGILRFRGLALGSRMKPSET